MLIYTKAEFNVLGLQRVEELKERSEFVHTHTFNLVSNQSISGIGQ